MFYLEKEMMMSRVEKWNAYFNIFNPENKNAYLNVFMLKRIPSIILFWTLVAKTITPNQESAEYDAKSKIGIVN